MRRKPCTRFRAFTFIELLISVAILITIASLLFSAFSSSKWQARDKVSLSNLRQIASATSLYVADKDAWPTLPVQLYPTYVTDNRILVAPNDETEHGIAQTSEFSQVDSVVNFPVSYVAIGEIDETFEPNSDIHKQETFGLFVDLTGIAEVNPNAPKPGSTYHRLSSDYGIRTLKARRFKNDCLVFNSFFNDYDDRILRDLCKDSELK